MRGKTFITVRADQYFLFLGVLVCGAMYAILDLSLFMWMSIVLASLGTLTIIRDWKQPVTLHVLNDISELNKE